MANNTPEIIAWDSCVITDCLQKKPGFYEFIEPLVNDAESGKLLVVVSVIAVAETFFIRGIHSDQELQIIDGFYDFSWVRTEAASLNVMKIARDLRRNHEKLSGLDSIHIATAIWAGAPIFLTYDGTSSKNKTPLLALDNVIDISGGRKLQIRTPESASENSRRNSRSPDESSAVAAIAGLSAD